jgi:cysteinyl-tRNA synthetase
MLDVLGCSPYAEPWVSTIAASSSSTAVIDGLVAVLLEQRAEARARKDFAAADAIRDGLNDLGVVIEDTPTGARWSIAEGR